MILYRYQLEVRTNINEYFKKENINILRIRFNMRKIERNINYGKQSIFSWGGIKEIGDKDSNLD